MRDYFPETDFAHQNYIVWVNLNVNLEGIKLTVVLQNIVCTVVNLYCRITQKWYGKWYINLELQITKINRNPSVYFADRP